MAYEYNGRVIREGRGWTDDNGVKHPANWMVWSAEEKTAKGLVLIPPKPSDAPYDNRFYWGRQADGTLIPRALDDVAEVDENGDPVLDEKGQQIITKGLKTQLIAQTKVTANALLQPTDWMIIRGVELAGKPPSLEVKDYRQAVRDASNQIEAAISVCTTIEDVIMLHTVPTDANGDPTGNAPINNWPEAVVV